MSAEADPAEADARADQSDSRGLRYMALGAFWFSVMSLIVKVAGQRLGAMQLVLVRGVLTLLLSVALLRRARLRVWGTGHSLRLLLLRGVLGSVALSCFYWSLVHLPLAEATVIQYTNPVFAALLAAWLLGERLGWREAACIAGGLVGVVLIARPAFLFGGASAISPGAAALALFGAVCSASAYVTVRRLGAREHPLVVVFYLPLLTIPIAAPLALMEWRWPTAWEWLLLLAIGVTTQIAQVYFTRGLQLERAARATAVGYLQIVFAALWGAVVFGELPRTWTVAGAALIVGSTLWLGKGRR